MTRDKFRSTMFLAEQSPGFDCWAFHADLYCHGCILEALESGTLDKALLQVPDEEDLLFRDSEILPQPVFFGEFDYAETCDHCQVHLYGDDHL